MTGRYRLAASGARLVAAAGLMCAVVGCPASEPDGPWDVIWEDTFDGPAGESPDPDRWAFDLGGHGWGNNELQRYTDRPANVALDGDGRLRIQALRETLDGNDYTSGRIKTQGLFAGGPPVTFKARIRVPSGRGVWPAFWLLGEDFESVGWPETGEVDILEVRGSDPNTVVQTVHGPGYSGASGLGVAHDAPEGDFADGFHSYAVVIEEDRLWWYVDDELTHTLSRDEIEPDLPWVFDKPFFIILNVAVGGHFVLEPTEDTPLPAVMEVDYVRVFGRPTEE